MNPGAPYSPDVSDAAADLVRRRTGLVFGATRQSAFDAALAAAMRRAKSPDAAAYLARLEAEPAVLDDLVAQLTVGETYFFREPQQFTVIRSEILPELLARRPIKRGLRMWSAGCATGEEPYTLAIVLHESGLAHATHLVATDLSRAALARACRGRYTRWSLRGVTEEVVHAYFELVDERYVLAPAIRDAVEFRYLNLAADPYPSLANGIWGMDLILCRNVLIYFDPETVARVAGRLLDSLGDGGWLLLGASDPALSDLVPCDVAITAAGLAYRRPSRGARRTAAPVTAQAATVVPPLAALGPPPLPPPPAAVPETPPAPVSLADAARAYAERDYGRAAELADRVTRHSADAAPWVVLVRALGNRGDLAAAGRACAAAIDRHRDSPELAYLHAVLLAEAGRHVDAAEAARRALYLDRGFVVAHLALGDALARIGDSEGARRAFRNAEALLTTLAPGNIVPASDGEPAGRLAEMARVQLRLLSESAA